MEGGLMNLVSIMDKITDKPKIMNSCYWAISNLCRGIPLPKHDHIKSAIPLLCGAIATDKLTDK
jgi:hypothetical protein